MRASNVGILAAVVAGLYLICCAVAMGQTGPAGQAGGRAGANGVASGQMAVRSHAGYAGEASPVLDLMGRHKGSLLQATMEVEAEMGKGQVGEISFFTVPPPQPKVVRKHDLVTIIVREESEFSSTGNSDLKKTAAYNAQLEQFIKVSLKNWKGLESDAITNPLGVKATGDGAWKGEATVDRSDTFTARVQAEVVDVKPNGTLVLQGTKTIKNDEEEQRFTVTGVCRAEDVTVDNTVLSTQLLDMNLDKQTKGMVRNTNKKGWAAKLLDVLSPF